MYEGTTEQPEVTKLTWEDFCSPRPTLKRWPECKCGSGGCEDPHVGWAEQLRAEWDKEQVYDSGRPKALGCEA